MGHQRKSIPPAQIISNSSASVTNLTDHIIAYDESDAERPDYITRYTAEYSNMLQHAENQVGHAGHRTPFMNHHQHTSHLRRLVHVPYVESGHVDTFNCHAGTTMFANNTPVLSGQQHNGRQEDARFRARGFRTPDTGYASMDLTRGYAESSERFLERRYRAVHEPSPRSQPINGSVFHKYFEPPTSAAPKVGYPMAQGGVAKNRYTAEENLFILKARQEPFKIPWRVVPEISAKWYSAGRGRNGRNMQVHYSQNVNPRVSSIDELTPEVRQFLKECINSKLQIFYKGVREELMKIGSCDKELPIAAVAISLRVWMKNLREKLAKSLQDASRLKALRSRQKIK